MFGRFANRAITAVSTSPVEDGEVPNFAVRCLREQAGDDADNPMVAGAAMPFYRTPRSKQAPKHSDEQLSLALISDFCNGFHRRDNWSAASGRSTERSRNEPF